MPNAHFLLCLLLFNFVNTELVQLLAVWRHGDRAPKDLKYAKDKNGIKDWSRGWEQLTNLGIQEAFELGTFLRERYIDEKKLFGPFFEREKIFIQSSDQERALESAQAVAAGLFPPTGNRVWNSSFLWQPTPIHSYGIDRAEDMILRPKAFNCPRYRRLNTTDRLKTIHQIEKKYADFFKYLSNMTGNEINGFNVAHLFELGIEIKHGLPQPDWVDGKFNDLPILSTIVALKKKLCLDEFDSPEKGKLRGGLMLNNLITYIEALRDDKQTFAAVLYSSHDDGLFALLSALGMFGDEMIPTAAVILFEIHRNHSIDNGLSVQIFYRNTTKSSPYLMKIPKCSNPCSLKDFLKIYEPMRVHNETEWNELCRDNTNSLISFKIFLFLLVFTFFSSF